MRSHDRKRTGMFYFVSKLLGIVVLPVNALIYLAVIGAGMLFTKLAKAGRITVAAGGYLLCGFGPVGTIQARPLEDRFSRPAAQYLHPTGIIVLGARSIMTSRSRGGALKRSLILAAELPRRSHLPFAFLTRGWFFPGARDISPITYPMRHTILAKLRLHWESRPAELSTNIVIVIHTKTQYLPNTS